MEEGRFNARGVTAALGYTKKGTPQVAVLLELTEGECAGEHITWYGYFSDAAKERSFAALRALGWEGDDLADMAGIEKNEVSITVNNEEYEGKWNLKVAWINPLGGLGLTNPMTPEQVKSFAATMKGDAIASRGGSKSTSKPKPRPKAPTPPPEHTSSRDFAQDFGGTGSDDDIPF